VCRATAPDEEIRTPTASWPSSCTRPQSGQQKPARRIQEGLIPTYGHGGDPGEAQQYDPRARSNSHGRPPRLHRAHGGGAGVFGAAQTGRVKTVGFAKSFPTFRGSRTQAANGRTFRRRAAADVALPWRSTSWRPPRAPRRGTMPDGGVLDLTVPEGVSVGAGAAPLKKGRKGLARRGCREGRPTRWSSSGKGHIPICPHRQDSRWKLPSH